MKSIRISAILIIITAAVIMLFQGCTNNGTGPSLSSSYMPLKTGNRWYYSSYTHNSGPDLSKITEVWEDKGIRNHRGIEFHIIERSFPADDNNLKDTLYYSLLGDNLYQLFVPAGGEGYVSMPAMFNIKTNGTFSYKGYNLEYVVTNRGTDRDKIKFFYNSPYAVDEEHTVIFQAGRGVYDSYSDAWGNGRRLVHAELK